MRIRYLHASVALHPGLARFRAGGGPISLIGAYLESLAAEADSRSYRFNRALILEPHTPVTPLLTVTTGAGART